MSDVPTIDDVKRYTGNNHLLGAEMHIALGNEPVTIVHRGVSWLFEWHYYCGPTVLNRKTGDPLKNPPGEKSPFWLVSQWWKDQGCRVVDGIGQWDEPPIVEKRYRRINKRNLIADESGDVILRHWKGYESWGTIRKVR